MGDLVQDVGALVEEPRRDPAVRARDPGGVGPADQHRADGRDQSPDQDGAEGEAERDGPARAMPGLLVAVSVAGG